MKSWSMTTQMKAADQHFHVILHAPSGLTFLTEMFTNTSVILLQIVMVSATPEQSSPGSKNNNSWIENAWAFMWPNS